METSPHTSQPVAVTATSAPPTGLNALLSSPAFQQFLKFAVVGASSTFVDKGIFWVLYGRVPWPWWVCMSLSFALGVTNGFIWNRLWTFKAHQEGHGAAHHQYIKFVISNLIGLVLNLGFSKLFLILLTGQLWHESNPPKLHVLLASLGAIPFVVIWNFTVARKWTFKKS